MNVVAEQVSEIEFVLGLAFTFFIVVLPIAGLIGSTFKKIFSKGSPTSSPGSTPSNKMSSEPRPFDDSASKTQTAPKPLPRPEPVQTRIEEQRRREAAARAADAHRQRLQSSYTPPGRCNKCRGSWVRRENYTTGGRFWGCSNYPRCTNTYDAQVKKSKPKPAQKKPTKQAPQSPKPQVRSVTPKTQVQGPRAQSRSKSDERTYTNYSTKGRDLSVHHTPEQRRRAERFWRQDHPMGLREECQYGHPFSEENTFYRDRSELGKIERECRICRRASR